MSKSTVSLDSAVLQYMAELLQDLADETHEHGDILGQVQKKLDQIDSKVNSVLTAVTMLQESFDSIKRDARGLDEKLLLMNIKIDRLVETVSSQEVEDYSLLCAHLYSNWEELEPLTKKFIPVAEFLFSNLQKQKIEDYSPVIIELCRAIENEFLQKIFLKYTADIVGRKGKNIESFLVYDKTIPDMSIFVKNISKAGKGHRPDYTLGQMSMILTQLKKNHLLAQSNLLQDFYTYLQNNTDSEMLLNGNYINGISILVREYRNPSAHPQIMRLEQAEECKKIMPDRIDYLLDSVRVPLPNEGEQP